MARLKLKWPWLSISLAALLSVAGWISNAISKPACQRLVGAPLWKQYLGGKPFCLLDPEEDKSLRSMFDAVNAKYTAPAIDSSDPMTWPRLSVKSHSWVPFFIAVDYFWEREAELGGGGTRWFVCFFGTIVELGETDPFAT